MSEYGEKSGEFEWIGRIRKEFAALVPPGMEGIGDDCAVIPAGDGESLVITTDMLIEDVHFVADKISPGDLGYKSLAVNLSDVAAMGATPIASFLSAGLPGQLSEDWRNAFLEGFKTLSEEFNVPLLGGDTTASGKLVINVTAIGKTSDANIKRRSAARPGDLICVAGNLGDSAAGLRLLFNKADYTEQEKALIHLHHHPRPLVKEGSWLGAQKEVHALMDISDGIASDLMHILKESAVSATVELTCLPVSDGLIKVCAENGWDPMELSVSGGEDYTLLLTVDPAEIATLNRAYSERFGRELEIIGRIGEGRSRIEWLYEGKPIEIEWKGFSHF